MKLNFNHPLDHILWIRGVPRERYEECKKFVSLSTDPRHRYIRFHLWLIQNGYESPIFELEDSEESISTDTKESK